MMTYKTVFVFAIMLLVVTANPMQPRPSEVIELEEACVRQGGICLREEDCDAGNVVRMMVPLCPTQHHLGVICCYN